jgi:hypothetical protein
MKIFRYVLGITDFQTRGMPDGARILSVQNKAGELCLWALVDPDQPTVSVGVRIVGTGNPFDDAKEWADCFVGTVIQGRFVWHVFARQP